MSGRQIRMVRITQEPNGGRVSIGYSYGETAINQEEFEQQWSSMDELKAKLAQFDSTMLNERMMMLLAIAWLWIKPNGQAGNPNQATNKTITFDVYAQSPLKVT